MCQVGVKAAILVGNVQGWQCERVVQRDGLSGKILLVLPADSAAHLKKVCRALAWPTQLVLPSIHNLKP